MEDRGGAEGKVGVFENQTKHNPSFMNS